VGVVEPRVGVAYAPQRDARALLDSEACCHDIVGDRALALQLLVQGSTDSSDGNVHFREFDEQAQRRESLDVALDFLRRRPMAGIHVHLHANTVDGDARLFQACAKAKSAVGFCIPLARFDPVRKASSR